MTPQEALDAIPSDFRGNKKSEHPCEARSIALEILRDLLSGVLPFGLSRSGSCFSLRLRTSTRDWCRAGSSGTRPPSGFRGSFLCSRCGRSGLGG